MKTSSEYTSAFINNAYLDTMYQASIDTTLGKIYKLWWPHFLVAYSTQGSVALNALDIYMNKGRDEFRRMAHEYASQNSGASSGTKYTQLATQFLKSNTGKMFERFIGLSIAFHLLQTKSPYCIYPFKTEVFKFDSRLERKNFFVNVNIGGVVRQTPIDADLICFAPESDAHNVFMVSIKSTLKDRFHNVPFWNLLRTTAISNNGSNISTDNADFLSKMLYIAVCTDLAEEQPDFAADCGPRNLLCIDAGLLDGAFVTASKALGVYESDNCLGPHRDAAFHRLNSFLKKIGS